MTELRSIELELSRFRLRLVAAAAFVLFAFGLLASRLVFLQIYKHDELSTQAENNRITVVPIVPNRGLIVDRNGVVLANNYSAYTLEITPSKIADLDATIDQLEKVVEVQPRDRKRFRRLMDESKSFESLPIRTKLTDEEVARFTAQRYRFPGVDIKARLFRNYPLGEVGSHVIGYIGRINTKEKEDMDTNWDEDDLANYRGTDYIGKLGIEQNYEKELHGQTGFEEVETSASGRAVRRLRSNPSTPGNTLTLSIDIRLQALVEELFGDRRGALVAIDPRDGEVLAFVSKPNFDPNLFVDGIDVENWRALNDSPDKPLLNRALRGAYPPGSTYKPFMAMAALTLGKRTPQQGISDPGYFQFGDHRFRDDKEGGHGFVDMYRSITQSCDTYYFILANDLGVDAIHDFMAPLSFGQMTGIDLQGELRGTLPSTEWKRKAYRRKEAQKWYSGETISLGIGQGYNAFTMLQLAQAEATIAAGGLRFKPRLVKSVENVETHQSQVLAGDALPPLPWKPEHVAFIHKALYGVTQEGTAARVFVNAPYQSGGKTGTAQVIAIKQGEKYNASKIDERHRDHALYTAFAPLDQPRIAIALVVENAGFGAGAAAPIARRVIDYVLQGQYPSEADIAATQAGTSTVPIGIPRLASAVPLPGYVVHGAMAAASAAVQSGTSLPQPADAAASAAATPEAAPGMTDPAVPPPLPEVPTGPAPTVEVGAVDRRGLRLAALVETKGESVRSDADAARDERRAAPEPAPSPSGWWPMHVSNGREQVAARDERRAAPEPAPSPSGWWPMHVSIGREQFAARDERRAAPEPAPSPSGWWPMHVSIGREQVAARDERRAAPKPARTPSGGRATYSSLGGLH